MFLALARFAESIVVVLIAQFTFAITMMAALSKRRICHSSSMNGKGLRSKLKASMHKMKMKHQKMCGGGNPPLGIKKDIFFSDTICQYLGNKRSSVKLEVSGIYGNF